MPILPIKFYWHPVNPCFMTKTARRKTDSSRLISILKISSIFSKKKKISNTTLHTSMDINICVCTCKYVMYVYKYIHICIYSSAIYNIRCISFIKCVSGILFISDWDDGRNIHKYIIHHRYYLIYIIRGLYKLLS